MRLYEFKLTEKVLQGSTASSWSKYLQALLVTKSVSLGNQGEKGSGLVLTPDAKNIVKNLKFEFDRAPNKNEMAQKIENTAITFTNGTSAFIKQIHKDADIKSVTVDATGENPTKATAKYWNNGEVAETFLGSAIYTRFLRKGKITKDDVLDLMQDTKKFQIASAGFVGSGHRDTNKVQFMAKNKALNNQLVQQFVFHHDKLEAQFPAYVPELDRLLTSCVDYVNQSSRVAEALEQTDSRKNTNGVLIVTDGITDNKGTKADLQITVGETLRLLSLKVNDVKQFGQDSGSSGEIIKTFFERFLPEVDITSLYKTPAGKPKLWNSETLKGWPDMSPTGTKELKAKGEFEQAVDQVYELTGQAYKLVKKQLEKQLQDDPQAVIANFYRALIYHTQGTAQKQTLVILNPTAKIAWRELEFGPKLAKALKSFKITVELAENDHTLKVFGKAKDSKAALAMSKTITSVEDARQTLEKQKKKVKKSDEPELLFQLRSYMQGTGYQRNIVEMGKLLKSITEVEFINKAKRDN